MDQNAPSPDQPTPQPMTEAEAALAAAQEAVTRATQASTPEPTPEEEALLASVMAAASAAQGEVARATTTPAQNPLPQGARPLDIPSFGPTELRRTPEEIALIGDVNLNVKIELGRTRMLVEDVLRLGEGAVVELDKLAGDPVDVFINDRHVARGEVLVLNDTFCVRISEILLMDSKSAPLR